PSRPTISPAGILRSTFSSTASSSPLPFGNDRQTLRISTRGNDVVCSSMIISSSAETQAALAEGVERPPEQTIEQCHKDTHRGDPEYDPGNVAGHRCGGNIGAKPVGCQMLVAPACNLRDNRGVPGASRSRDRTGDVIGENARQDHLDPPAPSPK